MTSSAAPRTAGASPALILPGAATLLALMNYTAPLATLSDTAAGLRAGPIAQIWVMSSISLGLAAALIAAGSLADGHGRRRVFTGGAVLLAVSSAVCAVAPDATVFVAGRIVQGAASAALIAAGLGIIGATFPPGPRLSHATGVWGAMLGLGIALGPIAAAGLGELVGWRLWYWVAVAASLALAVPAARLLPESRAARRHRLDLPGVLTMSLGGAALLAAITWGRTGWTHPATLGLLAASVVLLAAFVTVEARTREPMLDLALFRRPGFLLSVVGSLLTGLGTVGMMSYLPNILGVVLGMDALHSALLLAIWSGLSFVVAIQARRLPARFGAGRLLAVALALSAVGQAAMLGLGPGGGWWRLLPGLIVAGVGSGLGNSMLARLAVESVPPDRAGLGSGAGNTARYIGAALGVALVGAIVTGTGNAHASPADAFAHGANIAILVCTAFTALGTVFAFVVREPARAAQVLTPAPR
ncbi:MFS transporter [Actinomadura sp. NBRC 104412]|uniref:MFS transporter n=1 Tax=Actinomadura sp. NBRC 104412 TaxID=3032203 RepID=UPI00249FC8AF|nr:MFS transporter [Actinomadura sp. NBRC 104412]GLZ06761.1 MFS transporter [Actinomadura sp. NBRC 104412]